MNRALIQAFLVSGVVVSMSIIFAPAQDSAAEAALASAISDYERILKLADPITAGLDGDRDALRRLPDPRRETELAQEPGARGDWRAAGANRRRRPVGGLQRSTTSSCHGSSPKPSSRRRSTSIASRSRTMTASTRWAITWGARPASDRAMTLTPGSRGSRRCPTTTPGASPTCGAASRRSSRSRRSWSIGCSMSRGSRQRSPRRTALFCCRSDGCRRRSLRRCRLDYRNQALAILRDRVGPAQRTFAAFLAQDYAPRRSSRDQLAYDTRRRVLLPVPGPPRDDHEPDAGRDPSARTGGGGAHSQPDGRHDQGIRILGHVRRLPAAASYGCAVLPADARGAARESE